MSRYIDAEEALQIFKKRVESFQSWLANITEENLKHNVNGVIEGWRGAIDMLERQSTADVEKVRRGKWIKNTKVYRDLGISESFDYFCSCCRSEAYWTRHEEEYAYVNKYWRYCPNCGAKMDGGSE